MNKAKYLDFAETFDGLRIVPRIVLFSYLIWAALTIDRLFNWYMGLPIPAQSVQASAFCLGACGVVTGMAGVIYRIYAYSGRSWDTASSLRTSSTTTEVVK
jgi:hypothetical protein